MLVELHSSMIQNCTGIARNEFLRISEDQPEAADFIAA